MKRLSGMALVVCLIAVAVYFFTRPSTTSVDSKKVSEQGETAVQGTSASTPQPAITRQNVKSKPGDASEKPAADSPYKKTTHDAALFTLGDLQNLKIEHGALQLGGDASFAPRLEPYRMFGIYVSPEQPSPEIFDAVIPSLESGSQTDGKVIFEFRTQSDAGAWSPWHEVEDKELKQTVMLEEPGKAWQYRLRIFANDPANGPKVRGVSLTTRRSAAFSQHETISPPATPN
jgi:hypothetical protein